jgi:nicotinate-nucleotide adenylyltransferase
MPGSARTAPSRVGLFGGSFNPPHVCHVLASVYVLEATQLDEVWWLPVHRHAFAKDRELASWEDRLAMCEAAAAGYPRIRVDPLESALGDRSFTVDTVAALRRAHPQTEFSFIVGSDLLLELPRWRRWEELRENVRFVVLGRGEARTAAGASEAGPPSLPEGGRFQSLDFRLPDISSSEIRARLRAGLPVRDWIPAGVARYLDEHPRLYRARAASTAEDSIDHSDTCK